VIAEPLSDVGAVHDTDALAFAGAATTFVGANGTIGTVCAADCADGKLVPSAFVAVTEHV
jgi:hypothetical protein